MRTHFLVSGGSPQRIGGQCLEQLGVQSLMEASAFSRIVPVVAGPGETDLGVQSPRSGGWGRVVDDDDGASRCYVMLYSRGQWALGSIVSAGRFAKARVHFLVSSCHAAVRGGRYPIFLYLPEEVKSCS